MGTYSKPNNKRNNGKIAAILIVALAAFIVPCIIRLITTKRINDCDNVLRQIDGAKEQYALQHGLPRNGGTIITPDQLAYLMKGGGWTSSECPSGGKYKINPLGTEPECSVHGNRSKIEHDEPAKN